MSESDPISKENITKCEDSNLSQASSENLGTMPTFHSIEIVETPDIDNTEFVNESGSLNDEESDEGSEPETKSEVPGEGSESEASQDVIELDSEEDGNNAKDKLLTSEYGNNELEVQIQDDSDNGAAQSWPTLEILPGGIIRPTEQEYPYCIYVEPPENAETEDLMYACAKCPMRFKVLNSLTMHLRVHTEEKKKEEGLIKYKNLKPLTDEEIREKLRKKKVAHIRKMRKKTLARKRKLEIDEKLEEIQKMKNEHMKKMEEKLIKRLKREKILKPAKCESESRDERKSRRTRCKKK